MLLLLMRHGIAQPQDAESLDDFHRALTREGRFRTRRAARGLRQLVPQLDFLASSPKSRARATAQIVSDTMGKRAPQVTEWAELMEADLPAVLAKIRGLKAQTALLCGHEPHLSELASLLLTGSPQNLALDFKKAGVLALEIDSVEIDSVEVDSVAREAVLLWHLTPRQLRQIGR